MFRAIDRWGHVGAEGLNSNSVSRLLRMAFARNGLDGEGYSGHSLRRGLLPGPIVTSEGQSIGGLCRLAGCAVSNAYIDTTAPFGVWRQ